MITLVMFNFRLFIINKGMPYVDIADNAQLACPKCGKPCTIHDYQQHKWRHLDTSQFTTLVEANVPRIFCPEHGSQTLPVPWAGLGSRHTLLFEAFVLS